MNPFTSILTILAWSGVSVLVLLLYRIAHFYQVTSKQATYPWMFFIPLVLLAASGLRYAWIGDFAGDILGDSLQLVGGLFLIVLGLLLLRMMTGGRR